MKKTMIAALLAGLLPLAAIADEAAVEAVAPPTCKKVPAPNNIRRADDTTEFNDKFAAYQECIKTYVDTQNKAANAHVNAANKAVEDANAYVNEINAKLSAPK